MPSMEITDVVSKVANIDHGGYVSHSFNQFLQMDGEDLIALDHGDAYPRAAVLIKYPGIKDTTFARASVEHCNALVFPGTIGNNTTRASLGGRKCGYRVYPHSLQSEGFRRRKVLWYFRRIKNRKIHGSNPDRI